MFVIKAYRWTLKRLHVALTKAYLLKQREQKLALRVAAEATERAKECAAEAVELEVQAREVNKLLG